MWYRFVRWLIRNVFFRLTGGLVSVNEHFVPRSGGIIIAPLHLSFLDPPGVACATVRRLTFMAKEELFRVPILGPLIISLGAFRVRRGEGDTEAIRKTISLLETGHAVLIFPEGTRGDGKTIGAINRGVTMLAKRTNAPVVPLAIIGTNVVLPKTGKRGRAKLIFAFGEPFTYEQVATGKSEKENRERFAHEMQSRILALAASQGLHLALPQNLPEKEAEMAARED